MMLIMLVAVEVVVLVLVTVAALLCCSTKRQLSSIEALPQVRVPWRWREVAMIVVAPVARRLRLRRLDCLCHRRQPPPQHNRRLWLPVPPLASV